MSKMPIRDRFSDRGSEKFSLEMQQDAPNFIKMPIFIVTYFAFATTWYYVFVNLVKILVFYEMDYITEYIVWAWNSNIIWPIIFALVILFFIFGINFVFQALTTPMIQEISANLNYRMINLINFAQFILYSFVSYKYVISLNLLYSGLYLQIFWDFADWISSLLFVAFFYVIYTITRSVTKKYLDKNPVIE